MPFYDTVPHLKKDAVLLALTQFLTYSALIDAVSFGVSKPEIIMSYLSIRGIIKTFSLMLISIVVFCSGKLLVRLEKIQKIAAFISFVFFMSSIIITITGFKSNLHSTVITNGFFRNATFALFSTKKDTNSLSAVSDTDLHERFLELHHILDPVEPSLNFGVERDSNLILFVMETGSIEFLDMRKPLPNHPLWNKLGVNKYIGANHYSVFPASAESNFAILTGTYPPRAYYDTCLVNIDKDKIVPSIISNLAKSGNVTAIYLPYKSQVPMDKVVFEHVGFQKVFYGEEHRSIEFRDADTLALKELDSDIDRWAKMDKRFAVAFFPQIGHGPWRPDLGVTVAERGHKIVMSQLDWLLELINNLEANGVLSNTVIVLTGDHGVRTADEDPDTQPGMINSYSLHVPLIIAAPHASYPNEVIYNPTSHIDIAAEIAHLFGFSRGKLQQGLPLLDLCINSRNQFFMADWYFGADGYRTPTTSAMYSHVLDIAFERNDGVVNFSTKDIVKKQDGKNKIRQLIDNVLDVQSEWIRRYACGTY
jgi:hypothetical protein